MSVQGPKNLHRAPHICHVEIVGCSGVWAPASWFYPQAYWVGVGEASIAYATRVFGVGCLRAST